MIDWRNKELIKWADKMSSHITIYTENKQALTSKQSAVNNTWIELN